MDNKWKDFFYYSKGERRALIILTALIAVSGILIAINNMNHPPLKQRKEMVKQYIVNPDNAPQPVDSQNVPPVTEDKPKANEKTTVYNKPESRQHFNKTDKYPPGTVVELNTADTTILKKVPGIGSFFAKNIVALRDKLGGFYTVEQLLEVYRMDEERYKDLKNWFAADTSFIVKIKVNSILWANLIKHPYINPKQANIICKLRDKKPITGWDKLYLLEEFTERDRERLGYYVSFD